jgi:hypothetical protein
MSVLDISEREIEVIENLPENLQRFYCWASTVP